ncbi:Hint domain-containing protein [Gluconobacter sp. Dm-62]|uniref:Hint domain-containing protein n=1 Tax=Gluconobacter sp. Dm-62 TaxID=2799804 RepID=UPI001B8D6302|nr:Hint domain-containing protein [Gluconobacter sp. Dm-62]
MSSLTSSSLTWEQVIENGDESHSTVTLDSSNNAISVSGTVQGQWGSSDNSISGLTITGSNAVSLAGSGSLTVTGAVTFNAATTISGMTINANSSVTGGTVTIADGGTLIAQSVSSTINFGSTSPTVTNTVQLNTSSASLTTITNLAPGDVIEFVGNTWDKTFTWVENSDGTYKVEGSTGDTLISSVSFAKKADGSSYTPADFTSSQTTVNYNGSSSALTLSCFLPGTLIRTPSGDCAVEDLEIGDEVVAYQDGVEEIRAITWAGRKSITVLQNIYDDEAGYLVRILKNAISENVPFKDLLVTPEHCLFLDGKFVPARMLVNGRSIFYDRSITTYEYYHIETFPHSVIMADGMLTESYLDTGNSQTFQQDGKVVRIGCRYVRTWEQDVAAPLSVASETVAPMFQRLLSRAEVLDLPVMTPLCPTTHDADLHLVSADGQIIRKLRETEGHTMFMIPPGIETVYVMSNTFRPCDEAGSCVDDRRHLGVLVQELRFFDAGKTQSIDGFLTQHGLEGWAEPEASPVCRWTTGRARLDLGARYPDEFGMLAVQSKAASAYPVAATQAETIRHVG